MRAVIVTGKVGGNVAAQEGLVTADTRRRRRVRKNLPPSSFPLYDTSHHLPVLPLSILIALESLNGYPSLTIIP